MLEFLAQNSWDQKYIFRAPTKPTTLIFKKEPNAKVFVYKKKPNAENRKALINKKEPNAVTTRKSTGMPTQTCETDTHACATAKPSEWRA